jgi:hypothetical protein
VSDEAGTIRRSVLALAGLSIVGLACELLIERHWDWGSRLIPWGCLLALAVVCVSLARGFQERSVRNGRRVAIAVMAASVVGIAQHINENFNAGPLDFRYQDTWATLSEPLKWWLAASKSVGPAPTLAPGALIVIALLIVIATQRPAPR